MTGRPWSVVEMWEYRGLRAMWGREGKDMFGGGRWGGGWGGDGNGEEEMGEEDGNGEERDGRGGGEGG